MKVVAQSADEMLVQLCRKFLLHKHPNFTETMSRNGPVIRYNGLVELCYVNPRKRVVLNPKRDANPFFHLHESLWMLAGRNDVKSLKYFVSTISDFSDDGETFNGAYGDRWRRAQVAPTPDEQITGTETDEHYTVDQLVHLIRHLKEQPNSRRAVLQMWDVRRDLLRIDDQVGEFSKDVCCNLCCVFEIAPTQVLGQSVDQLNMTVFNRSNDLIWGSLGANVVHFSILQEYVAMKLGIPLGRYSQVSVNLHMYTKRHQPKDFIPREYTHPQDTGDHCIGGPAFDSEVGSAVDTLGSDVYEDPFLREVYAPMMTVFKTYKEGDLEEAIKLTKSIDAPDWRAASKQWVERRLKLRKARAKNKK